MSIPTTQQTLAITSKHGPWDLFSYPVDQPGLGEVLVRVEATALNPVDWKVQATSRDSALLREYPAILGSDSAGVVVALGEGVTNLTVGDRVLHQGYFTNRLATFKQYTVAPADVVAKIPDNVTFDQAASIPLGLATASIALYNKGTGADLVAPWKEGGRGKYAGQPLVLFGGSTSVGQYVLQLAKLSGFSPIITTVSPHNNDLVRSLGATHVIDRNLPADKIIAAVKEITSEPVEVVYDSVSQESTELPAYDILAPGGTLILVSTLIIPQEKLSSDKTIVSTIGNVHVEGNREFGQGLYKNITSYLQAGELKANAVEVLPSGLTGIVEGLARMQKDQVSGRKLISRPQETK